MRICFRKDIRDPIPASLKPKMKFKYNRLSIILGKLRITESDEKHIIETIKPHRIIIIVECHVEETWNIGILLACGGASVCNREQILYSELH